MRVLLLIKYSCHGVKHSSHCAVRELLLALRWQDNDSTGLLSRDSVLSLLRSARLAVPKQLLAALVDRYAQQDQIR